MWGNISLWFWFAIPWWLVMLNAFSGTWPFVHFMYLSSLEECLSRYFVQFEIRFFFFLLLSCVGSLHILDMNLFRYTIFKYFLSSHSCLLILLMIFFAAQMLLKLTWFHLSMFALFVFSLRAISSKECQGAFPYVFFRALTKGSFWSVY